MSLLSTLMTFSTPVPTPSGFPDYKGDPNLITPGVVGFIVTFVVALATVFLLVDMNRRIRRTRYREEVRDKIALEKLEAEEFAAGDDRDAGRPDSDSGPDPVQPRR